MVSRIIERVTNALGEIADDVIQFPNTIEDRQRTQEEFRRHIRIPGILGLIDCFLVALRRPSENEEAFYNYKGYHGLNVQVVSDANYLIRNVRICPGSNNDRHVWQYSDMKEHMEALRGDTQIRREEGRYYFIGDSGYTPSPVFLTPIRNAVEGTPQAEYTREIVQTRCRVEQLFGTFTAVWRSIKRERRMLYKPEKAAKIIIACATLYNFRLLNGIVDDIPQRRVPINEIGENMNYVAGIREREYIINTYYGG